MVWEELIERFEKLHEIFFREANFIPAEVNRKIQRKTGTYLSVPIIFYTRSRKKLGARINLDILGSINVTAEHFLNKARGVPASIIIVNQPSSSIFRWARSYKDFLDEVEKMFPGNLHALSFTEEKLSENSIALQRAYYNLRRAAENYFEKANKVASAGQRNQWIANKEITIATNALREVVKACDDSRATVGPSKTIGGIRDIAVEALRNIDYSLIQQNIVVLE